MTSLRGFALGVVFALSTQVSHAVDLQFNFRLLGEIDHTGGTGSVSLSVAVDEVVLAQGSIESSAGNIVGSGVLSDVSFINSALLGGELINEQFSVPLSLDLNASAALDIDFSTSSTGEDIDFRSGIQNAGGEFGEAQGLQGLTLESVTIDGGGSLVSGGLELVFSTDNTELTANATNGGAGGTVVNLTSALPSILADADGESLAGITASLEAATGPIIQLSAFPDAGASGGEDIAEASLRAVRDSGGETPVALPNIQLIEYVPEPADYNANGLIDVDDYVVWRNTFGETVETPGDGADGNEDGVIDLSDFTVWRDAYVSVEALSQPAAFSAAPSPSALVLLVAAAVGLPRRFRV